MFLEIAPDLVDPQSLAETRLPSLAEAIGLTKGEAVLTIDPTLTKPVRIRPSEGANFSPAARQGVEDLVFRLNDVCSPFNLEFLKAKVRVNHSVWPLDLEKFVSGLHLLHLRAQECHDFAGGSFLIDLAVRFRPESEGGLEPSIIAGVSDDISESPAKQKAFDGYTVAVKVLWSNLVKTSLGQWIRDNGVQEFRLSGETFVEAWRVGPIQNRGTQPELPAT